MIAEGIALCERAFKAEPRGLYTLQAGIAAAHVQGSLAGGTDWSKVIGLYDDLVQLNPSPIVSLNRAVAVSMRDGPRAALGLVNTLLENGGLDDYGLAFSAQGDMFRRLGRFDEARDAYRRALDLATQDAERRFLESRVREVSQSSS